MRHLEYGCLVTLEPARQDKTMNIAMSTPPPMEVRHDIQVEPEPLFPKKEARPGIQSDNKHVAPTPPMINPLPMDSGLSVHQAPEPGVPAVTSSSAVSSSTSPSKRLPGRLSHHQRRGRRLQQQRPFLTLLFPFLLACLNNILPLYREKNTTDIQPNSQTRRTYSHQRLFRALRR